MGKGKKKELQPKVNQVTLFLPTAFRQCAKIAVKQKLRPVTQLTKHFYSYGGATPRSAEKKSPELDGGKQAAPFKGIRQSVGNRLFAQWHAA